VTPRHAVPGDWADQAACRGSMNTMEVPRNRNLTISQLRLRMAPALRLCAGCPVVEDCYRWVMKDPDPLNDPAEGLVAGGLTPLERDSLRRGINGITKRRAT
jgi:hypothetical protein